MSLKTRETIIALGMLFLALSTIFILIPWQVETGEEYELASLSPAFFPRLAAWSIAALALILLIRALRGGPQFNQQERDEERLTPAEERRTLVCFAIAAVYVPLFIYLGFFAATTVTMAALSVLQGQKGYSRVAALALGVSGGVYAFFHWVMKVHFPVGLLFR